MGSLSHFFKTARRDEKSDPETSGRSRETHSEAAPGAPVDRAAGEASRVTTGTVGQRSAAPGLDSKGLQPSMNTLGELVAGIVKKAGSEK